VEIRHNEDPTIQYEILPELSRGAFGTVFLCKDKSNGLELAVKIMPFKKKKQKADLEREIEIMSCLNHPR
jgi:myosin-light-chain kinase